MARTHLQLDADRHVARLRHALAEDLRRLREDAGATQTAIASLAGVHPSVISRIEARELGPTLETYARVAAALGADLTARVYPQSGPAIHDRHQVRMSELVLASLHPRWRVSPEVAVRRPVRGWIDLVLRDPVADVVIATELESGLRRIEQLVRWSREKADALTSSSSWESWRGAAGDPRVSSLLVVRWTRANRDAASAARRTLREAYPADPRDALEALAGTAVWPGHALVWALIDRGNSRLSDGSPRA
jgi:transcriptional regulator with XRE-family HTH domain